MFPSLSKLKFYGSDEQKSASSSSNDDSKVSDEIMKMGDFLQQQYGFAFGSVTNKAVEFGSSSLIPLFLTAKMNNVPDLISIVWDVYCQWKLTALWRHRRRAGASSNKQLTSMPKSYSIEHFLSRSPMAQNASFDAESLKLWTRGMTEYYFNYFWPISRSPTALINDSFAAYAKYAVSMAAAVKSIVSKNEQLFPLHIDFWIVPKSVVVRNTKQGTDAGSAIYTEQFDDILMDVGKRLELGGVPYLKHSLKNEKSNIGISQLFARKIVEVLKQSELPNGDQTDRRVVVVIDRRNEYNDFTVSDANAATNNAIFDAKDPPLITLNAAEKTRNIADDIFFYVVDSKYGNIPKDYISERLIYNTQQWLLPFTRVQTKPNSVELDGGANFGWKHQSFLLSFHIAANKETKAYWHLNGDLMRFLPRNLIDIWPHYFYSDKDQKLQQEVSEWTYERLKEEWKLKVTDKAFQHYYAELIGTKNAMNTNKK